MTLIVRPAKGYLTHNTNYFTSMDPYCYLYLGKQAQKTAPHYGGGIRPEWKEVMKFKVDNIVKLGIQIWTKAIIGNDTLIGQGLLDLNRLPLSKGDHLQCTYQVILEYVDIFFNNKSAGRVLLELKYIAAEVQHKLNQVQKVPHKIADNNGWEIEQRPHRKSWAGEMDYRGSNFSNNIPTYQPQSAIYIAEGNHKGRSNTEGRDNTHRVPQISSQKDFHKKPVHQNHQKSSRTKQEQQKANQYLNQQIIKNFALKKSNVEAETPSTIRQTPQPKTHQQQQILYEQQKKKQMDQMKLQQQTAQQQYQMMHSPLQNLNNIKPSTGLTPGTVYAKPDNQYNPNRVSNVQQKSNIHKQSHVGLGTTPPKSILTPPKIGKPKSPGKKVQFADQK